MNKLINPQFRVILRYQYAFHYENAAIDSEGHQKRDLTSKSKGVAEVPQEPLEESEMNKNVRDRNYIFMVMIWTKVK